MDLLVTDKSPSEISDKIKELVYAKAADRVETLRPAAVASLFGNEEETIEDEIETEPEETEEE